MIKKSFLLLQVDGRHDKIRGALNVHQRTVDQIVDAMVRSAYSNAQLSDVAAASAAVEIAAQVRHWMTTADPGDLLLTHGDLDTTDAAVVCVGDGAAVEQLHVRKVVLTSYHCDRVETLTVDVP